MPEIHDPMSATLEALRSDVERTPLADSLAVRRRGDRRTRDQAIGGALVVVALVAGAVGYLVGGLTGDDQGLHGTPAQGGGESVTAVAPKQLADLPLLTPADMPKVGPYTSWQASPDPVTGDNQPSLCVPSPSDLAAVETQSVLLYTDLDAQVQEHALRFATEDEASAAVERIANSFAACGPGDPAEVSTQDRGPITGTPSEGVSGTLRASRLSTPVQDADISYYELGLARVANVLVVLQWSSMGNPTGVDWVLKGQLLDVAAQRAVDSGA